MLHEQRFTVSFEYPVHFVDGVFSMENTALRDALCRREPARRHRVALVLEERVKACFPGLSADIERYFRHHGEQLALAAPPLAVAGGEECKNDPDAPERLARWFDSLGLDRQSFVVIVGGGSLLDMAGWAAAITHRGLRVVRVPTTVLAQNDSGVGVKNGVNAYGKKNFFGTFSPPFAVLSDPRFLETLEPRDKVSGMAEAVKVALIKDRDFFEWIEARADALAAFDLRIVSELVRRCAVLHLEHIATSGDPFELGSSRPLDFGHWVAHKLESLSRYSVRHGEAVAIGIAIDSLYSADQGLFSAPAADRVVALLDRLGLPIWDERLEHRSPTGRRVVLDGIQEFREHLGGELTLMMLESIGRGREVREVDEAAFDRVMDGLARRFAERSHGAVRGRPLRVDAEAAG